MAIPTVSSILAGAAQLMGDQSAEQFTSAVLLPYYSIAYREMIDLFIRWGLPIGELDAYALLRANTTILTPSAVGINSISEPLKVWERGGISTLTITGVTNATPMVVTVSGVAPASGTLVEIYNTVGPVGINHQWRITNTGASTFSLNGSIAGGAYSSGGTVLVGGEVSSNPFREATSINDLPQVPPSSNLRYWKWESGSFFFIGATQDTELLIEYAASGEPPQSGSVGIDNCANFLIKRTASLADIEYDMKESGAIWKMEAVGQSGEPDGSGGALRSLALPLLKEKQKRPARSRPFRSRRTGAWRGTW